MKALLNSIHFSPATKSLSFSIDFIPESVGIKSVNYLFKYKPYSTDEVASVKYFSTLPKTAPVDTCKEVLEDSEETVGMDSSTIIHRKGVYRFTKSWELEGEIYFGNSLISNVKKSYENICKEYDLSEDLDYSDIVAYFGSVNYKKIFN